MSKSVEDGGYVVVFDNGDCSHVLDNKKDIEQFVSDNEDEFNATELTIYKLVPCEYKVGTRLTVEERE